MEENNDLKLESFSIHTAKYNTLLTKKFKNRVMWQPTDLKMVYSAIPGTVRQIFIKTGKKVEAGEIMLELEAMKMYNKILAPVSGTIKAINIKTGERVPKNFLMVEFK
ncbi:MAG: acetyl-CoA carboxylase biotin carboxyl carrier protein subunit [Bacteroidetes bacterium HGW-Bacteroidetes-6]|jgi:biotin carboxyl carrier protein|nr:MAG: acetyl-CoA carboxylase biotin carboxyl carrier protein subunit [Bacteroidetes bacterium HGW-Bacteroidetes-6]